LLVAAIAVLSPAQTVTTLMEFDGTNGSGPASAMVEGTDGNLYGTASAGPTGDGLIFKLMVGGVFTIVHNFVGADGSGPGGLMLASDESFYGVTGSGGANGYGTIFRYTPPDSLVTLYNFTGVNNEVSPNSPLVQGYDGNLYGTMYAYGPHGIAYRTTPSGDFTILHTFSQAAGDGTDIETGLILANDGVYYGSASSQPTWGTIFSMTASGDVNKIVTFDRTNGGSNAYMVQADSGELYGVTFLGGTKGGLGTIFKSSLDGLLTTLFEFSGPNGETPTAPMVQATSGNFYGTTSGTGLDPTMYYGTIFCITPAGALTNLYHFSEVNPFPVGGLVQMTDGNFYGTTAGAYYAGSFNDGSIFKLEAGLDPFVKLVPHAGPVGSKVLIIGSNFGRVNKVTFGGTNANFTVVSPTLIQADVPTGAETGHVLVSFPNSNLLSDLSFHVLP
jgi:uncharacterized repeat protein (TIGR03803 family)